MPKYTDQFARYLVQHAASDLTALRDAIVEEERAKGNKVTVIDDCIIVEQPAKKDESK